MAGVTQVLVNPPEQVEGWLKTAIEIVGRAELDADAQAAVLPEVLRLLGHGVVLAQETAPISIGGVLPGNNGLRLRR